MKIPSSRLQRLHRMMSLASGLISIRSILISIILSMLVVTPAEARLPGNSIQLPASQHATGIILFIGDGMGDEHRKSGRWAAHGISGQLAMDTLPHNGWLQTSSANAAITDSAAAATAMATGVKTDNGHIGVDPDEVVLETILEIAEGRGMATGLVTTVEVSQATPAAFAAHVPDRNMVLDIALQLIDSNIEVLLGGGEDDFLPTGETGCFLGDGKRIDGRNLITEAMLDGVTYVCDVAAFHAVDPTSTTSLLGLFADEGMTRPYAPTLAEMTALAIDMLESDPDGFFLMVEGGQIDWASHANDGANVIGDVIGFDEAVQVGLDYTALHPDTLVIVTADHETGGMSASLTPSGYPDEDGPFLMPDNTPFYINWTTYYHTADDVPVSTSGPWSSQLAGTHQNTKVFFSMRNALDWWLWLPMIHR